MQTALAESDVSVLVLPGDVSALDAPNDTGSSHLSPPTGVVRPSEEQVAELARLVDAADTVTLFVGAGIERAREQVLALADRVKAPIGHCCAARSGSSTTTPTTSACLDSSATAPATRRRTRPTC